MLDKTRLLISNFRQSHTTEPWRSSIKRPCHPTSTTCGFSRRSWALSYVCTTTYQHKRGNVFLCPKHLWLSSFTAQECFSEWLTRGQWSSWHSKCPVQKRQPCIKLSRCIGGECQIHGFWRIQDVLRWCDAQRVTFSECRKEVFGQRSILAQSSVPNCVTFSLSTGEVLSVQILRAAWFMDGPLQRWWIPYPSPFDGFTAKYLADSWAQGHKKTAMSSWMVEQWYML